MLRRTNLSFTVGGATTPYGFGYDAASRLTNVTAGGLAGAYGYAANSPLLRSVIFRQNGTVRMTTTQSYDRLNRLQTISSVGATSLASPAFDYEYNNANQRLRMTQADGSYWRYEYDALG